jgi:hypothetical protein
MNSQRRAEAPKHKATLDTGLLFKTLEQKTTPGRGCLLNPELRGASDYFGTNSPSAFITMIAPSIENEKVMGATAVVLK